jgi:hypothetical protein
MRSELDRVASVLQGVFDAFDWVLSNTVLAGYGGLNQGGATDPLTVDATWRALTVLDTESLAESSRVSYDVPNGAMVFDAVGVWRISVGLPLEHDELNAGRTVGVRLWDVAGAQPLGSEYLYYTGRNQGGSNIEFTRLIEVGDALVGAAIQVQLGGYSSYASVTMEGGAFEANHESDAAFGIDQAEV